MAVAKATMSEILEVVKAMPGVSGADVCALCPEISPREASKALSVMYSQGVLTRRFAPIEREDSKRGGARGHFCCTVNDHPEPTPPAPVRQRRSPTLGGLAVQVAELKARIAELEAWKADALKRYPVLAIPPIVIRARRITTEALRDVDRPTADRIEAGLMDRSPIMLATIHALGDE